MNSRERVRLAVQHQETDRLPIDFIARDEIAQALAAHFHAPDGEALLQRLNVDLRPVGPTIKQQASPICYADPTIAVRHDDQLQSDVFYDIWGVGFVRKYALGGEYLDLVHSPLRDKGSLDDLAAYPFPTADIWDYDTIADQTARHGDYCLWAHSRGFFEISWFMRGMDQFMLDLNLNREYAETLMDRIIDYLLDRTVRILEADRNRRIDIVEINDDVGGQHGLLLSPELWREFIRPRMDRMIRRIKQFGVLIRYHSCGGIREIIPDLIELGVDILNPVQPLARGMELDGLKRDFGARITFDGGVDTQRLLPHRHADEFEAQTRDILRMMGRDGGFIMAPSHALQTDVPLENILKLYELSALPLDRI
ncbi:MAG TPA: uroporphyrinogen decarboxylase family protein [Candidatus Sumerlaeota bacterium]|nr:uroporphyrinogen decarboxylase family protein [Candidatus Sumerlaeota bacterium]